MVKNFRKRKINEAENRIREIEESGNPTASEVVTVRALLAEIAEEKAKMERMKAAFTAKALKMNAKMGGSD